MDPDGKIYEGEPGKVPAEDKARLDGYLRGRSEAARLEDERQAAAGSERARRRMAERIEGKGQDRG